MKRVLFALFGLLLSVPAHAAALPSGYTELTYVNMPVGAYLLTDIVPTYDGHYEMDFQTTTIPSAPVYFLGGRTETYGGLFFAQTSAAVFMVDAFGNTADTRYTSSVSPQNNTRYKFTFNNKVATLESGGVILFTNTFTGENANGVALCINGRNDSGTVTGGQAGIYLYSFKAWNAQGQLVADMIPAKYGDTIGLYDTVRNRFFENSGSGSFLPGEELSPCRNLFDGQYQEGIYSTSTGVLNTQATNRICNVNMIPVKPSTTYVVSAQNYSLSGGIRWLFYDENKNFISANTSGVTTITTPSNAKYINFYIANDLTVATAPDLQLEESSKATTYVPYDAQCGGCSGGGTLRNYVSATGTGTQVGTPTPENPIDPVFFRQGDMILRAVGDYKDTYNATTGKITRNVGVKVLNGTENWAYASVAQGYYLDNAGFGAVAETHGCLCSHFLGVNTDTDLTPNTNTIKVGTNLSSYTNWDRVYVEADLTQWPNVVDFKDFLAAQYAAGTPVTIYYPLATPVVEDWDGGATYCETGIIKIATNLYNSAKFQNVIDALDTAVSTINTIVAGTIAQANSIGELASGKQTRPNPADSSDETCPTSCPNYRQCLLVEKDDNTPCWYEILDPFYNLFTPVIANDTNAASTTAQNASGLPLGYTLLDYIEFSGTQYINTGLTSYKNTDVLKTKFRFTNVSDTTFITFQNPSSGAQNVGLFLSDNVIYYQYGRVSRLASGISVNTDYTCETSNGYMTINGTNRTGAAEQEFTINAPLVIGTAASKTTADSRMFKGRIYYYRYEDKNGNVLFDGIPAKRNSDNVLGMYDLVSGQFFTNAGTGDFTAGNVVSSSPETVWTATFAANAGNNIPAGTVYGTAMCNATSGTANTAATNAQMSANNWTASGNYCWCRVTSVNTGGTSGAPSSEIWVYDGTSATCDSDCVGTCATSVATGANKNFRKAISGLN